MPNSPFKPSPLSFGSPRASPFRRPSTPNSPPQGRSGNTPGSSPGRGLTPVVSPSKLNQSYTIEDDPEEPSGYHIHDEPIPQPTFARQLPELPPSPTKGANLGSSSPILGPRKKSNGMMNVASDAAANLSPAQLREIREAFQVLDRDNDGSVNRDDVGDVLVNVGLNSSAISQFFPPSAPQTINFPTFLDTLSDLVSPLSSRQELVNALAAFDDDDSGQVDVNELRDALLHTSPEEGEQSLTEREIDEVLSGYTGRRVFGGKSSKAAGGGKRGEVFRYQEFVDSIMGGTENGRQAETAQIA